MKIVAYALKLFWEIIIDFSCRLMSKTVNYIPTSMPQTSAFEWLNCPKEEVLKSSKNQ